MSGGLSSLSARSFIKVLRGAGSGLLFDFYLFTNIVIKVDVSLISSFDGRSSLDISKRPVFSITATDAN